MSSILAIDIGGSGIKTLLLDSRGNSIADYHRQETPYPATPNAVLLLIKKMATSYAAFERVAVGFPGVVKEGIVYNAPNLGTELWARVPLQKMLCETWSKPVRILNDADMQGCGVVSGQGVEMVLTLGTGLGSALFVDGKLVPNLELGHHVCKAGCTYEEWVSDKAFKSIGAPAWSERVLQVIAQIEPIWNYDVLHIGGGNVLHLTINLPNNVRTFTIEHALRGAACVWA